MRFSANSNEMRVRVDASKNRLTIVAPRSVGTFLIARSEISLNGTAVSRTRLICPAVSCSSPSRSLPSGAVTPLAPRVEHDFVPAVELLDEHVHARAVRRLDVRADDVRLDGELAPAAVDEHGQPDPRGAAEVGELVERGADGAAGEEHVVDDHHVPARRARSGATVFPTTGRGPIVCRSSR